MHLNIILTLCVILATLSNTHSQNTPYGNNPAAGHYVTVGDAKLYYETYGSGKPIVLLHGGVYGYIDEFTPFIDTLKTKYKVICIATRGHGKSEAGEAKFTYSQRAHDAMSVIRSITKDSVTVLGFSDGGYSAMKLAAEYPAVVKRLIAIGMGDKPKGYSAERFNYNRDTLLKEDSAFFASRLQLMPQPEKWNDVLKRLNSLYNDDYMSKETFSRINCPTLVMAGDRDHYVGVESVVQCARTIPNAQLSIIPGCHHVVFFCNFKAVWASIAPFVGMH